jgi:hypothetical protein
VTKFEVKKLLQAALGIFPNLKIDGMTENLWIEKLASARISVEEGKDYLIEIKKRKEFVSFVDVLAEAERRGRSPVKFSTPDLSIVKVERVSLELLPEAVFQKLRALPSSENFTDPNTGRSYFRTTQAGRRLAEHHIRVKNPHAVKILTHFSNGSIGFCYAYDGRAA